MQQGKTVKHQSISKSINQINKKTTPDPDVKGVLICGNRLPREVLGAPFWYIVKIRLDKHLPGIV